MAEWLDAIQRWLAEARKAGDVSTKIDDTVLAGQLHVCSVSWGSSLPGGERTPLTATGACHGSLVPLPVWATRSAGPPCRPRVCSLAVDDLRYTECFETFYAEFQAVAGLLRTTEGNARVHGAVLVDPYGAGLDPGGDFAGGAQIGGPD